MILQNLLLGEELPFRRVGFSPMIIGFLLGMQLLYASPTLIEPVQACIIPYDRGHMTLMRAQIAHCLHWQDEKHGLCQGHYQNEPIPGLPDPTVVDIEAERVSLYRQGRSTLTGDVRVRTQDKVLQAHTAYVYRDAKTHQIRHVELLDRVVFLSPEGRMTASKAQFYPQEKEVNIEDVLYRLNLQRHAALLPAWGRAKTLKRVTKGDLYLSEASYTHCSPKDNAWEIDAKQLYLDNKNQIGVAKHAMLRLRDLPVFYTPYLSFPLSKKRKSGFLMPIVGSSNISGFDLATPYYLNLAPNYDATLLPHWYGKRGVMMGGQFRYLTAQGTGSIQGDFLSHDHTFARFLNDNVGQFPTLANHSTDRWDYWWWDNRTLWVPNLTLRTNVHQVSDNYYLQDFNTSLDHVTERQLLREGVLDYNTEHWLLNATVESYQTLHPVNEVAVTDTYQRLPQLLAQGNYEDLPLNSRFQVMGTFDYFRWPTADLPGPEGQRFHMDPKLSFPQARRWGYVTPSAQWVGNAYNLTDRYPLPTNTLHISVPRFDVDSGLYLQRKTHYFDYSYTQTLEPRLYYLNVPYQNQANIPTFESGYMIFSADQLFRNNRFSGFDRIGDANQLAYGITSRWLRDADGEEKASMTVGQLAYFANRKVFVCYSPSGFCEDNPLILGFLSPTEQFSPVASHAVYRMNHLWSVIGDYVWDPATRAINNGQLNLHYQRENNRLFNVGYTYLVNGDLTQTGATPANRALNQASASYAWPLNDYWSTVGAYGYNVSKNYEMMALFGVQYDSCCWAMRLLAGRTFRNLNNIALIQPQSQPGYTNSVFLQLMLKGLGSVGNASPTSMLQTFVPGYQDTFRS